MGKGMLDGVSDGEWSVFAEKVVAERDAARAEVARLRVEANRYTFRGGYVEDESGERWWSSHVLRSVEIQRDYAREEVVRLRDQLKNRLASKSDAWDYRCEDCGAHLAEVVVDGTALARVRRCDACEERNNREVRDGEG